MRHKNNGSKTKPTYITQDKRVNAEASAKKYAELVQAELNDKYPHFNIRAIGTIDKNASRNVRVSLRGEIPFIELANIEKIVNRIGEELNWVVLKEVI